MTFSTEVSANFNSKTCTITQFTIHSKIFKLKLLPIFHLQKDLRIKPPLKEESYKVLISIKAQKVKPYWLKILRMQVRQFTILPPEMYKVHTKTV